MQYNLIADFQAQTFKLYCDLDVIEELKAEDIPTLKYNCHIRSLNAFKNLFIWHFIKRGYKSITQDEKSENMTFKVICSEFETFMFLWQDENGEEYTIKNFDTEFIKISVIADIRYMVALEEEADALGFKGATCGGAVRKYWKNKSNGFKMIKYKYNTEGIDDDSYNIIRLSTHSGLNVLNPMYKNKLLYDTITIDINSLYPYLALSEALPYDKPVYESLLGEASDTKKYFKYKAKIYKCELRAEIKSDKVAWVSVKNEYGKNEINDALVGVFYLWGFELDRIKKDYNINELYIIGILHFKVRRGSFDDIFNRLKEIKENAPRGSTTRQLGKQYLNAFLGKFATKRDLTNDSYEIAHNDIIIKDTSTNIDNSYYLPLFSYITAKGRCLMAYYINDIIEKKDFIYCDTDSITTFKNAVGLKYIDLDNVKFGRFKVESENVRAYFKKPKFYAKETTDGEDVLVLSGINTEETNATFDDFVNGAKVEIKKIYVSACAFEFPQEILLKVKI